MEREVRDGEVEWREREVRDSSDALTWRLTRLKSMVEAFLVGR